MNKGGKRNGSGRKSILGKEIKIKLPYETINKVEERIEKNTLSDKIRVCIDDYLLNTSKYKKYRVVDLFSGCGGISEGFSWNQRMDIVGAIDFDGKACTTYKYNFPHANVIEGDITKLTVKDSNFEDIDIIVGGPPCQGFSALNRHQKLEDDPRNKLFFEYLRFVKELRPKALVIENVKQILTKNDGFAKKTIFKILEDIGYNVDVRILNASEFGVPQHRERAIFIAIRNDIGKVNYTLIDKYKVSKKTTVKEAIGDLYEIENIGYKSEDDFYVLKGNPDNDYLKILRNSSNYIFNHKIQYQNEEVQKRVSYVPQGGNWRDVPPELFPSERDNRHSNYLRRFDENGQSTTIDTGHDVYYHPIYNRVPTVRESARLQSFPDRFIFIGTRSDQLRQVGNAVPPMLAYYVSKIVLEVLENGKKD